VFVLNPDERAVKRIDPEAIEVTHTLRVGGAPSDLAVDDDVLWVLNENGRLRRLDPDTLEVLGKPISAGARPERIAAGDGIVWVTDPRGDQVSRVEP